MKNEKNCNFTSLTCPSPPSSRLSNACLKSLVHAFCKAKQQNRPKIRKKLHKRDLKRENQFIEMTKFGKKIEKNAIKTYFKMIFPFSKSVFMSTLSWNMMDSTISAFSGVSRSTKLNIDTMAHTICIPCESYTTAMKIKFKNLVSKMFKLMRKQYYHLIKSVSAGRWQ